MEWQGVMKVKVVTISPYDSIRKGHELMAQHNIRHLLVTDGGELKGVVSDRDIFKVSNCDVNGIVSFPHCRIDDIMVSSIKTCGLDANTHEICQIMLDNKIDCVPIVSQGEVHGLVTSSDLVALLAKFDKLTKQETYRFDFHLFES